MNILKTPFKIEVGNIKDAIKVLLVLETYGFRFNTDQKIEILVPSFFRDYREIIIYVNAKKNYLSYSSNFWKSDQDPKYGLQYTVEEFLNYGF